MFWLAFVQQPIGQEIRVPLDYSQPQAGSGSLYFELGANFDGRKPTIFLASDGQQFFLKRGAVGALAKPYEPEFNVVGVIGRINDTDFVKACAGKDGKPDYRRAWQIFRSAQWVGDIESVRRHLLGQSGHIMLVGASGGAMMVQQYLARYGKYVTRCAITAPYNPEIESDIGVRRDTFWSEIAAYDSALPGLVTQILASNRWSRVDLAQVFQRQHFFLAADQLQSARGALIRKLAQGDDDAFKQAIKDYQVDAVEGLLANSEGLAIMVREFEFWQPTPYLHPRLDNVLRPEFEQGAADAAVMTQLYDEGQIGGLAPFSNGLRSIGTQALVLAGRWDEAVDYRTAIGVAETIPNHTLMVFDDNHVLTKVSKAGLAMRLYKSFLLAGPSSEGFRQAAAAAASYRWHEGD